MPNNNLKYSVLKKLFWILFITPIIITSTILILISYGVFGFMPTFEDLENPKNNIASEVISEDHEVLGTFYYQNRSFVTYNQISLNMFNALVATEDIRFYKHSGVDFRGLARVFFKTIILGNNTGGGSTITQQLAKNLFPRDTLIYESWFSRKAALTIDKFKEWETAIKLERNYTKNEILVMYLNTVPFGSQAFGIKMASKSFFNKSPDSLKIEEAAILVGMLKAPSYYNPIRNPERSKRRRNVVILQMARYGYISEAQCDSICNLPLKLTIHSQDHNEGPATYFREYLRNIMSASKPQRSFYFVYDDFKRDSAEWIKNPLYGWCSKHNKPDGTNYNLYVDGLKIYTTINSKMQKYAEEAVTEQLSKNLQIEFFKEKKGKHNAPFASNLEPEVVTQLMKTAIMRTERYRILKNAGYSWNEILKNFKTKTNMTVFSWYGDRDTIMKPYDSIKYYKFYLQAGFMSMDPHTGLVKAYVGGPNFKHFKYDHVVIGKRQAGSTIKPFIYTLAMQEGYSPCDKAPNVPVTFLLGDTVWTPRNSGNPDYENKYVTLRWALANSVNYISAWLMQRFNPPSVIDIMKKMGVTSHMTPVPSLILGTSDISLYEMVGAYSTYANKGIFTQPIFVTSIEDKDGNVLAKFTPEKVEAISEQTAYLMINLLEGVVNYGTGFNIRHKFELMNPIAGKTGTTQKHSDGWFLGITPDLVSGAWVGAEDRSIHFDDLAFGSGSHMALPIWALYMQKVYADRSLKIYQGDFKAPADFNVDIDCPGVEEKVPDEDDLKKMEGE
jgi:penicillin-binding protein 1A